MPKHAVLIRLSGPVLVAALLLGGCSTARQNQQNADTAALQLANGNANSRWQQLPDIASFAAGERTFLLPDDLALGLQTDTGAYLGGRIAERQSDYGTAAFLFGQIGSKADTDLTLVRRAFLDMVQAGRFDDALQLAERLNGTQAGDIQPLITILLAGRALQGQQWQQSMAYLDEIQPIGLARYAIPLIRAWALVGMQQHDQAVAELDKLAFDPGFDQLRYLQQALVLASKDDPHAAITLLQQALPDDPRQWPPRLLRTLVRLYLNQQMPEKARQLLHLALNSPNPPSIYQEELAILDAGGTLAPLADTPAVAVADAFYHLASGIRRQADQAALIYARVASFMDPGLDLPWLVIGDILDGRERFSDAIDSYRHVQPGSSYYGEAQLRIGQSLINLDADGLAIRHLERLAQEDPQSTDALMQLGFLMRLRENYGKGTGYYDQILQRDRENGDEDWSIYYYRGVTLERQQKWPEAEQDFLKALEIRPNEPLVLNYLGYSWVDQGLHLAKAEEMIKLSASQRPDDGYIIDSLGWVYYRLGKYEQAVPQLELAVELRPHDPTINHHLGDAYWQVGRKREARFQWARALILRPDPAEAATLEQKLAQGLP